MFVVLKFPNGVTAKTDGVMAWQSADATMARLLNAFVHEPSEYSPDPLLTYARAVAAEFGGELVADTREREPLDPDAAY
jgi:hypothetical protein